MAAVLRAALAAGLRVELVAGLQAVAALLQAVVLPPVELAADLQVAVVLQAARHLAESAHLQVVKGRVGTALF